MEIAVERLVLHYSVPFGTARVAASDLRDGAHLTLTDPATRAVGRGEACPDGFYGETVDGVLHDLTGLAEIACAAFDLGSISPGDAAAARDALARADVALAAAAHNLPAARSAVDMAVHDLIGTAAGLSVRDLLGLPSGISPTDLTLGLTESEDELRLALENATGYPAVKVKLGGRSDREVLEFIAANHPGRIRVDANTGWDRTSAGELLPHLERLHVEFIEQPFPAGAIDDLAWLSRETSIPVVADESVADIHDIERVAGAVAGVNVKLVKFGGIAPSLAVIERAHENGLKVLLGCMGETRLGIAAAVALGSLAEWIDLDGCLLLTDDPFFGIRLDDEARWLPGPGGGLGTSLLAG